VRCSGRPKRVALFTCHFSGVNVVIGAAADRKRYVAGNTSRRSVMDSDQYEELCRHFIAEQTGRFSRLY
jgi:hypothetical protein